MGRDTLRQPNDASQTDVHSLIIIGAGPAGLAAAAACKQEGLHFRIVEAGRPLHSRSHENAAELGHGSGGAGLYSDGKFSFFPSATELWSLQPKSDLKASYDWLLSELRTVGLPLVDAPLAIPTAAPPTSESTRPFVEKRYLSTYGSLQQRKAIISSLESAVYDQLYSDAIVTEIAEHEFGYRLTLSTKKGAEEQLIGKRVLLASGRFGPLLVQRTRFIQTRFRRFETGIRIEQPTEQFFLATHPQVDPKLIFSDLENNAEYRTFCCCRNGEIVAIEHEGIAALSGRADGKQSGFSNVGFHVRVLDEAVASRVLEGLLRRLRESSAPVHASLSEFLNSDTPEGTPVGARLGPELASLMHRGLKLLAAHFGEGAFSGATIHYPAVEGFGHYPVVDDSLRIPGARIWVAGDVSGRFRGLVAALVSGYFAGLQVARELRSEA